MIVKIALASFTACGSFSMLVLAGLTGFPTPSTASPTANAQIPAVYLVAYQRAALTCPGLDWTILAGIGKVESNHGINQLPGVHAGSNEAGAQGPMQFLPTTFATYDHPVVADPFPTVGGARPRPSPYDLVDAIYATARYLCASRVGEDVPGALITYNCGNPGPACQVASAGYAADVLATAASYRSVDDQPGPPAQTAVNAAKAMLGTPYVWGGTSPEGFDCSGLTQWAYAHAGTSLPRTAQLQYDAGPTRRTGVQPGDLVFFGTSRSTVDHVGIYIGDGLMVNAPHAGAVVRLDPITGFTPPYVGATAPGNSR